MDIPSYLLGKKSGGGGANLQSKSVTITENGTTSVTPDEGYNGMSTVSVTTNVPVESDYDWSVIGYSSEPPLLSDAYNYAVQVKNNWSPTIINKNTAFKNDKNLFIMPAVDFSNVTKMNSGFSGSSLRVCPDITAPNLQEIDSLFNATAIKKAPKITGNSLISLSSTFDGCTALEDISNLAYWSTDNVTNVSYLFNGCVLLTNLNSICNWDASKFSNAGRMFYGCTALEDASALNNWNQTSMTYTASMFQNCRALETAPLFDTSKVTDMSSMFNGASALENVPIYDTSSVTGNGLRQMFLSCSKLTDQSLNNIMKMCINATKITANKNLAYLYLTQAQATRCQSLSNYQDFLDAGWTTGY